MGNYPSKMYKDISKFAKEITGNEIIPHTMGIADVW
jgi:hypothetical protein